MNKLVTMTVDEWERTYLPIPNHLDDNASWQDDNGIGIMFETYGTELEFVDSCNEHNVWTYVDSDLGTEIISGKYSFNRIGYFVTKKPWSNDVSIPVTSDR